MKKIGVVLVLGLFLISFAIAQAGTADGTGLEHDAVVAVGGQDGNPTQGEGIGVKVMAGNYRGENGQQMMIQQQSNNRIQLRVNNVSADCNLNLTQRQIQNKTKLETKLNNGRNAEIKVMPDTASETALTKLRLRVCNESNNCTIELKEVGKGNQTRAAYEIQAERHFRILGMFRTKAQVRAQVDAENGEVIQVKKPWWAFLASEPDETEEDSTE